MKPSKIIAVEALIVLLDKSLVTGTSPSNNVIDQATKQFIRSLTLKEKFRLIDLIVITLSRSERMKLSRHLKYLKVFTSSALRTFGSY